MATSERVGRTERFAPLAQSRPAKAALAHRDTLVAAGVLLLLTLIFFAPVLDGKTFSTVPGHETAVFPWRAFVTGNSEMPQSDQADLNQPWQTFFGRSLRHGRFPFWEPYGFAGGHPFFANGSSALLYPPHLLTAPFLSPSAAHDAFSMLHVFLAGLCMYLLLRELGGSLGAGLLAAVAWMFGSFNMAWLHLEVVTPLSVFLPLCLLLAARAFRLESRGATVAAGLGLSLAITSGHLVLLGIVCLVALVWIACLAVVAALRRRADEARVWLAPLLRASAMAAIGLGGAAIVLLPTYAAIGASAREPFTYSQLLAVGLAPWHTFVAYTFRPPPLPATEASMHQSAFVGTIAALLAIVGFFFRRGRGAWLGRIMLVCVVLVATGTPLTWFVYHVVPGFDVFTPYSRLVAYWDFGLALLAGLGLDVLLRRLGSERWPLAAAAVVVALVGANAAQTARYGREVNPAFTPREPALQYGDTPLVTAVRHVTAGAWPGRILPVVAIAPDDVAWHPPMLLGNESWSLGIESANGYDSVIPRPTADLVRVLEGVLPEAALATGMQSAMTAEYFSNQTRFDLARRLGITTVVATPFEPGESWAPSFRALGPKLVYDGPDGRVYSIGQATRGPYLVHQATVVPDESTALKTFVDPTFDYRSRVVLVAPNDTGEGGGKHTTDRVEVISKKPDSIKLRVESAASGWVVIPDAWAQGWTATVNGRSTKVLRANYDQRAVRVEPGSSDLELRYLPPRLIAGGVLTVSTLAACLAWLVLPAGAFKRLRAGSGRALRLRRRPGGGGGQATGDGGP